MNLENASFEEIILDLLSQDSSWLTKDEIIGSVNGQLGRLGLQKRLTGNFFDRAVKKLLTERKIIISRSKRGHYFSCDPSMVKPKQTPKPIRYADERSDIDQQQAIIPSQLKDQLDTEFIAERLGKWAPVHRAANRKANVQSNRSDFASTVNKTDQNLQINPLKSKNEIDNSSGNLPIQKVTNPKYWIDQEKIKLVHLRTLEQATTKGQSELKRAAEVIKDGFLHNRKKITIDQIVAELIRKMKGEQDGVTSSPSYDKNPLSNAWYESLPLAFLVNKNDLTWPEIGKFLSAEAKRITIGDLSSYLNAWTSNEVRQKFDSIECGRVVMKPRLRKILKRMQDHLSSSQDASLRSAYSWILALDEPVTNAQKNIIHGYFLTLGTNSSPWDYWLKNISLQGIAALKSFTSATMQTLYTTIQVLMVTLQSSNYPWDINFDNRYKRLPISVLVVEAQGYRQFYKHIQRLSEAGITHLEHLVAFAPEMQKAVKQTPLNNWHNLYYELLN